MTQISMNDVRHLAQLSSLQLDDTEAEALRVDLEAILGYIEQLSELDTTGVEPTYQVTDLQNVWRDDVSAESSADRAALLATSPATENNQIKVPKVL